jgi:penicillin amidase
MASSAIAKLLRERPAGWFNDYDEMLVRALADAVEEGRRAQGDNIASWQYGRQLRAAINNPVMQRVPVIGKYFNIGLAPMSGSGRTVKQTTRSLAPSMRMTADLADWDRSLLNLQIGQSGQVFSRHYRDEWEAFYYARSFPMEYRNVDAKSTLEFRPVK